ncbi:AzlD domain-containing protein [Paenibacillus tarimensis]
MEVRAEFLFILAGVSLVTLLPRILPLVFLSRIQMPEQIQRFLRHIPVAVMAALLAQALLTADERLIPLSGNVNLLALIPTLFVAVVTRSLLGAVIAGMVSMMILQLLI